MRSSPTAHHRAIVEAMRKLAVVLALQGCSIVAVHKPPSQWTERPRCTSSMAAPTADIALMGASLITEMIAVLGGLATSPGKTADGGYRFTTGYTVLAASAGVGLVGFTISGGYGGYEVKKCRRMQAAYDVMGNGPRE